MKWSMGNPSQSSNHAMTSRDPLTVSEIFNGECDAMVDVTLIRPLNKVKVHATSRRHLSSAQARLVVPRTRTKYGDRSFAVQGPRIWNSLPAELRAPDGSKIFNGECDAMIE